MIFSKFSSVIVGPYDNVIIPPITNPPRSPDLNPWDFFIWGDLKTESLLCEYRERGTNVEQNSNAVQELQNEETLRRLHFNVLQNVIEKL
ncbi:hypothetical protein NQ317_014223 [Molorchus minor]|uniref:Uncharacterized protein n=1 Tax=Molorchus minor TaxID=1323400 RepID=A0ABQ9JXL6_9CUCU|nr:hypothetical protein NQ317_014223 [Molorchus minor]